ncbi:TPA: hypothetical protein ACTZ3L_003756 [Bacillus cereus]|uniref:hypothetical protein n=1 Tax=Bacillus TaxID=1386 RepID=UPI0010FF70E4|nr:MULTISPECIES: hypothetical protein [Bacillus]MDA1584198.1 hypothetical protein [Bacillus cereus group sp. TH230-1LC]MBG9906795.1 hypothetical protein [Bacillus paranthracis]QCU12390.1 hypothetical protein BCPR1_22550 [Bacillus paranthracis]TNP25911.1 hypothetical protein FH036_10225 [Bacillus sp. CD3-5]HDR4709354.1 hypothetical protein [Bacillus paranthracis]
MNNKLLLTLSCSVLFMGLAACDSEPKKEEVKQATTRNGASEDWTDNSKDKQETKSTFKKVSMDQYIKNYNKIKEKMKKEGKETFPFEYEKQDHLVGYTVYSTKSKTEYQSKGYTEVEVYLNDAREVVRISYKGNVTDMNTIQAMTEATNIKWTKEMENLVLARQRHSDGIKMSNGVSFDAYVSGNDDEISIEIWTNHNDR